MNRDTLLYLCDEHFRNESAELLLSPDFTRQHTRNMCGKQARHVVPVTEMYLDYEIEIPDERLEVLK